MLGHTVLRNLNNFVNKSKCMHLLQKTINKMEFYPVTRAKSLVTHNLEFRLLVTRVAVVVTG